MAIVGKSGECGEVEYAYQQPDEDAILHKVCKLLEVIKVYISKDKNLEIDEIGCDFFSLSELVVRVDKRKDYFLIYHNQTQMNEIKESALICYWILKFRPFSYRGTKKKDHFFQINEIFATEVLLSAIKEVTKSSECHFSISSDYVRKLIYAFRYWDISKEAMMLICESQCEAMCRSR